MDFKLTAWRKFSGGVAHGMYGENPLISLVFSDKTSYDIFSDFFTKMDKTKLKITFLEFQKEYSIVIYEDPGMNFFPEIGFYADGMNMSGFYAKNRELLMNNNAYFSYTFQGMGKPHSSQSMYLSLEAEPIKISQCQIISETDLVFKTEEELRHGISADTPFLVESSAYFTLKK